MLVTLPARRETLQAHPAKVCLAARAHHVVAPPGLFDPHPTDGAILDAQFVLDSLKSFTLLSLTQLVSLASV